MSLRVVYPQMWALFLLPPKAPQELELQGISLLPEQTSDAVFKAFVKENSGSPWNRAPLGRSWTISSLDEASSDSRLSLSCVLDTTSPRDWDSTSLCLDPDSAAHPKRSSFNFWLIKIVLGARLDQPDFMKLLYTSQSLWHSLNLNCTWVIFFCMQSIFTHMIS